MADHIFNVAQLLRLPSGAARDYEVKAPPGVLEVAELDGPVRGRVRLVRFADAILAQGAFEATVVVTGLFNTTFTTSTSAGMLLPVDMTFSTSVSQSDVVTASLT